MAEIDTIVAPITAPGAGERSALRVSGPRAQQLALTLFRLAAPPRTGQVTPAGFDAGDGLLAPVKLFSFRAPRSYTGEDVIEVHLAGWPALVTAVLAAFVAAGARPAAPGEFTRRAVVNGRLSVAQALAVGRLVSARAVEETAAAGALLAGTALLRQSALREALLSALALCEAQLDFEEEDTGSVPPQAVRAALAGAADAARRLAEAAGRSAPQDGLTDVVLLGPPNAGKSALFAALCPQGFTTVSPQAGSTRDRLCGTLTAGGRTLRLHDGPGLAAGVLAAPSPPGGGEAAEHETVEELMARAMRQYLAALPPAAVVIDVEDGERPSSPDARAERRRLAGRRACVRVLTKSDRPGFQRRAAALRGEEGVARLPLCAPASRGLNELLSALLEAAPASAAPDGAARLESELAAALLPDLDGLAALPDPVARLPLVCAGLREALAALDGEGPPGALAESLLDRIFADFCIGK